MLKILKSKSSNALNESMFIRWKHGDESVRNVLWAKLDRHYRQWAIRYTRPFLAYSAGDKADIQQNAADIVSESIEKAVGNLHELVKSGTFVWMGATKFDHFFRYKLLSWAILNQIKKGEKQSTIVRLDSMKKTFTDTDGNIFFDTFEPKHEGLSTDFRISMKTSLQSQINFLAKISEQLKINNKFASASVAEIISLFLKYEVAKIKGRINGHFFSVPSLASVPIEELISGMTDASVADIYNHLSGRDFRTFMLRYMLTFEIEDQQAETYCRLLDIDLSNLNTEVLKTTETMYNKYSSDPDDFEQAREYLKKFYKKIRNLMDQRFKRFWQDISEYYVDDTIHILKKEVSS